MGLTSIQWTDRSVNPIRARLNGRSGHHCVKVSQGCANCYASKMQVRFGMPPFTAGKRQDVELFFDEARLKEVITRKKPTRFFWCDMTDLFGEWVPDEWIDRCFAAMALTPQHTHQILTKRPERMRDYMRAIQDDDKDMQRWLNAAESLFRHVPWVENEWPLSNVWLGVSVEDQATADERIPLLLQTPAAIRFVSAEPLLGPVDLDVLGIGVHALGCGGDGCDCGDRGIDWLIVGGESGPQARPCDVAWIRSLKDQAAAASVPCFVKQLGSAPLDWDQVEPTGRFRTDPDTGRRQLEVTGRRWLHDRKGGDPSEWPADLRVREWPR